MTGADRSLVAPPRLTADTKGELLPPFVLDAAGAILFFRIDIGAEDFNGDGDEEAGTKAEAAVKRKKQM